MSVLPVKNSFLIGVCIIMWALMQLFLYSKSGVKISVDSQLYLEEAHRLLNGSWPQGRAIWYVGYSSFLAFLFFLGVNNAMVVMIQVLLSGIAACCLYLITLELSGQKMAAIVSVLLYSLWFPVQEWNMFLYTESLFTSCSIISFAALLKSKKTWQYVLTILLIVFTFFIRPSGFSFLIGLIGYGWITIKQSYSKKTIMIASALIFIGVFFLLNAMLSDSLLIESYAKGEVIYPNISLGILPPVNLFIPTNEHPPLVQVIEFVWHNPFYFMKLFFFKWILFFANVKPYFSTFHNVTIIIILYSIYAMAIKGCRIIANHKRVVYFLVGYMLVQSLSVAMTSENWDGRFLVPILPFIFIVAGIGMSKTFQVEKFIFIK